MTVVGEAFVAILPLSTGFAAELETQLQSAGLVGKTEKALGDAGTAGGVALSSGIKKETAKTASALEQQFANAGLVSSNSFAARFKNALSIAGLDSGPAFTAAFAVAAVAGLAAIGNQFANVRKQIQNETGATGAELTTLADETTAAFRNVPVTLGAAATAVDELFRRGVPLGPQLENLAQQQLFLAKVTKEDLGTNVEATTGLMQRFNVPLADQSRELDVLFKAYQQSGKSFDTLTSALQTGGAVLQQFGFGLDKSSALLASLEKASVTLQPALAGLRLAFGKITKEGGDPQAVLASLFKEFTDGTPKATAAADAIKLFGTRSGAELTVAIEKGTFDVNKLLKTITDGQGGIIATGLATLTLRDRFRLLRNNVEADLSHLGESVRTALLDVVTSVGPPLLSVVSSIGHLISAFGPAAADLGLFFAPLKLLPPLLTDVAAGINGVADVVNFIATALAGLPGPIGAIVLGAGILTIGLLSLQGTMLAGIPIAEAFGAAIEFALGPIGLTIAALAVVGGAFRQFQHDGEIVKKTAGDIGSALFSVGSGTTIFKDGITSAAQGLESFLTSEAAAGKIKGDLLSTLTASGTSVQDLGKALTLGTDQWHAYRDSVVNAAISDPLSLQARNARTALDEQRDAFIKAAQSTLTNVVLTKELTAAQVANIEASHKNADGTINYAASLDAVNLVLASHVTKQDAVIQSTQSVTDKEAALAQQLASGAITSDEAKAALVSYGLSAPAVTAELAALNKQATDLQQTQDLAAQKTAPQTAAYRELATELASGTITATAAADAFVKLGFSITGAPAAVSALKSAVDSFVSSAVSKLPQASQAIQDFSSAIASDQSQLTSDLKSRETAIENLGKGAVGASTSQQQALARVNLKIQQDQATFDTNNVASTNRLQTDLLRRSQIIAGSGGASQKLQEQVAKSNAAIIADYKKLADDQDPNKFTKNLLTSTFQILQFTANLKKLVSEGFSGLAGALAAEGPKAAAGLAAGFANNASKAAIANSVVALNKKAVDSAQTFLEKNAGPLTGAGAQAGIAVGKAIADGITAELLKNFPELRAIGVTTGKQVLAGSDESTKKADVGQTLKTKLQASIPEFHGLGVAVGTAVFGGAQNTLDQGDIALPIRNQLTLHIPEFRGLGVDVGTAIDTGISAGVILSQKVVGDALITLTAYGVTVVKGALKISSPSKVFSDMGEEVGAGLAAGIGLSTSQVGAAGVALANETTSSVQDSLRAITLPPLPVPHVAPIVVTASLAPIPPPAPVVVPASLSRLDPPPPFAPMTISARVGPIAPLPPLPSPKVGPVTVTGHLLPLSVPSVSRVEIPAALSRIPDPVVAPIVVTASLGHVAPPVLDPVALHVSALDTTGVHAAGVTYGTTLGEGITAGIAASAPDSGLLTKRFAPTLPEMNKVAFPLGKELAHGIEIGAQQNDAALKKFLEGLAALPTKPVSDAVTFAQTFQTLPVATPQARADAQHQLGVARSGGVFDGATLQFPEKIDPLHLAHELAWLAHGAGIET